MNTPAAIDRETVTAWLDTGSTLDEVERDLLEPAPLSDEQRAALWLFAWSEKQRRQRKRRALGLPRRPEDRR